MTLGRKNGGPPEPFWDVDWADGLPYTNLANNAAGRLACGWVFAPEQPAYDPATEKVIWLDGAWAVVPLPPPPASDPLRVTKSDFSRLFTLQERAVLNAAKAKIRAMTEADYANPALMPLVQLEIVLDSFELPAEFIELDHPETILAVEAVLVGAGILSPERAAEVLAGSPPA